MRRIPLASIFLGGLLALLVVTLLALFVARHLDESEASTFHEINGMVAMFQVLLEVEIWPLFDAPGVAISWAWVAGLATAILAAAGVWRRRRRRSE